jgi:hypothetical protein
MRSNEKQSNYILAEEASELRDDEIVNMNELLNRARFEFTAKITR